MEKRRDRWLCVMCCKRHFTEEMASFRDGMYAGICQACQSK